MTKEELEKKVRFFEETCRKKGLKITPQRLKIYKELVSSKEHPTTTAIYQKIKKDFPSISFDTVNRNLRVFSNMEVIDTVPCFGDAKRFDADISQHHHFSCIKCERIIDVYNKAFDNIKIPQEVRKRFSVMSKTVMLKGICDKCK